MGNILPSRGSGRRPGRPTGSEASSHTPRARTFPACWSLPRRPPPGGNTTRQPGETRCPSGSCFYCLNLRVAHLRIGNSERNSRHGERESWTRRTVRDPCPCSPLLTQPVLRAPSTRGSPPPIPKALGRLSIHTTRTPPPAPLCLSFDFWGAPLISVRPGNPVSALPSRRLYPNFSRTLQI